MSEVGDLLRAALKRKDWTIQKAAEIVKVDRFFLGRIVNGQRPPRERRGGRSTMVPDDRYRRLAVGLELDDVEDFLEAVARAQAPRRPPRRIKIEQEAPAVQDRPTLAIDLESHYPELMGIVDLTSLGKGEAELENLVYRCLDALLPQEKQYWQGRLRSLQRPPGGGNVTEHAHIGSSAVLELHRRLHPDARLCLRIADELTDSAPTDDKMPLSESRKARVKIASLFFELGLCSER